MKRISWHMQPARHPQALFCYYFLTTIICFASWLVMALLSRIACKPVAGTLLVFTSMNVWERNKVSRLVVTACLHIDDHMYVCTKQNRLQTIFSQFYNDFAFYLAYPWPSYNRGHSHYIVLCSVFTVNDMNNMNMNNAHNLGGHICTP